jgi:hypothetical protein
MGEFVGFFFGKQFGYCGIKRAAHRTARLGLAAFMTTGWAVFHGSLLRMDLMMGLLYKKVTQGGQCSFAHRLLSVSGEQKNAAPLPLS